MDKYIGMIEGNESARVVLGISDGREVADISDAPWRDINIVKNVQFTCIRLANKTIQSEFWNCGFEDWRQKRG